METKLRTLDFKDHQIYVGLDVHKKNWTVSIMVDEMFHKKYSQDRWDQDFLPLYKEINSISGMGWVNLNIGFLSDQNKDYKKNYYR